MADPTAAQRKMYAKMHVAMPDGSYYIRNGPLGAGDLANAIKAVGQTTDAAGEKAAEAVRKHIMLRAKAIGLAKEIPDTWNPDGSLKHFDVGDFLEHFGVKGMKWGVRRGKGTPTAAHPTSSDSSRAVELRGRASAGGTRTLSNEELQHLVTRMNLEGQYSRLSENSGSVKKGENFVKSVTSGAKTGLDAYRTINEVKKVLEPHLK